MTQRSNEQAQMEEIRLETGVLVLDGGAAGANAALEIAGLGYPVILAEKNRPDGGEQLNSLSGEIAAAANIEVISDTGLAGAAGVAGDFKVWLYQSDELIERQVGAIVVSADLVRQSLEAGYGLELGHNIISQSALEDRLNASGDALKGKSIAFLVGLGQNGNPVVMKRVLESVAALQEIEGCTVYVYVNDLKVAHEGLERLYLEGRDKGAIYIKLREQPKVTAHGDNLEISYLDPVLRREMTLNPDMIVVEEEFKAAPENEALSELLNIHQGSAGFLQKDNIHRYPVETNREGIFVIGGSRGVQMPGEAWIDAGNVAVHVQALLGKGKLQVPEDKAVLDTGKCTFCLTCFRCCPHGAIYWETDNKPTISKVACQGCGICASECPMDAIQIGEFSDQIMRGTIQSQVSTKTKAPCIIAFCCQNSALEAGRTAEGFKMDLPEGLKMVQVPCAGKVDMDYIMTAFADGADGVMVMACHTGNCKSEQGNTFASWRVAEARQKLEAAGLEKERLCFVTLASNMGAEFSSTAMAMEEKIKEIGLSPLGS